MQSMFFSQTEIMFRGFNSSYQTEIQSNDFMCKQHKMAVDEILQKDVATEAGVSRLSGCAEMVALSSSFVLTYGNICSCMS